MGFIFLEGSLINLSHLSGIVPKQGSVNFSPCWDAVAVLIHENEIRLRRFDDKESCMNYISNLSDRIFKSDKEDGESDEEKH